MILAERRASAEEHGIHKELLDKVARHGRPGVLKTLLAYFEGNLDLLDKDQYSQKALCLAVMHGETDIVKQLLDVNGL